MVAGDVVDERPSYMAAVMKTGGPIAAAELQMKWDAHNSVKGTGKEEAMQNYVKTLVEQAGANGRDDVLLSWVNSKK